MANPHNFSTKLVQEPEVEANNTNTTAGGKSRDEPPNITNRKQLSNWSQEERDVFSKFLLAQWEVERDLEWKDRSRSKELFATACNMLQALFPEPEKFTFSACNKQWKRYVRDLPEFRATFDFSPRPESPEPAIGSRLTGDQGGTRKREQGKSEEIKVIPNQLPVGLRLVFYYSGTVADYGKMSSIGTLNSTLRSEPTRSSKTLRFNSEQTAILKNAAGLSSPNYPNMRTRVRLAKEFDVPQKRVDVSIPPGFQRLELLQLSPSYLSCLSMHFTVSDLFLNLIARANLQ